MRVLVDTHVMLWWMHGDGRLSERARSILREGGNEILWSLASSWEIAVKLSIGKLDFDRPVHRFFADLVTEQGVEMLPIEHHHCTLLSRLPLHHRDPFDRMLVVQAQNSSVPLLSADPKLRAYDVEVLW